MTVKGREKLDTTFRWMTVICLPLLTTIGTLVGVMEARTQKAIETQGRAIVSNDSRIDDIEALQREQTVVLTYLKRSVSELGESFKADRKKLEEELKNIRADIDLNTHRINP